MRRGTWVLAAMLLLAACSTPPPASRPAAARLFLECRPGESGEMVQLPVSGVTIAIGGKPVFFESDLIGTDVAETDFGRCLRLRLAPAAAADLARLSLAAPGRRLVLNVDGRWIGARRVDRPLLDGSLYVFVEVADDRLPELARSLRPAGQRVASAPVPEGRRW